MLPLLGMTADPDDTELTVQTFPGIRIMRDFGINRGANFTPYGTGKWRYLPKNAIMHVSIKGDIEQLWDYLSTIPLEVMILWTWHHEPMGNVAPALYRSTSERGVEIIRAHPRGHVVVGNGPLLTRYWLAKAGNNPDDYAYEGQTFFGADCYEGDVDYYRPGVEKYGHVAATARRYGVPWIVGENGSDLLPGDDGTGRAAQMLENVRWAQHQEVAPCLGIAWWGRGGNRVIGHPIETEMWNKLQNEQGSAMAWRPAHSIPRLFSQCNAAFPNRSKVSDGIICDEHHEQSSDHCPHDFPGWGNDIVTAGDVTHDPARGADMGKVSEAIRVSCLEGRERRVKYCIFNRRYFSANTGWKWVTYTGENPHDKHMHVSVVGSPISDSTKDWEIGIMTVTSDDVNTIWGDQWEIPGHVGRTGAGTLMAAVNKCDQLLAAAAADVTRDAAHAAALTGMQTALTAQLETIKALMQALAAAETGRDTDLAEDIAAIDELIRAGGGNVDTAVILAEMRSQAAGTNALVETLLAENAELRAQLAAVPDAVADEAADRLTE